VEKSSGFLWENNLAINVNHSNLVTVFGSNCTKDKKHSQHFISHTDIQSAFICLHNVLHSLMRALVQGENRVTKKEFIARTYLFTYLHTSKYILTLRLEEGKNELKLTTLLELTCEILLFCTFFFLPRPPIQNNLFQLCPTSNLKVKFLPLQNSHIVLFFL